MENDYGRVGSWSGGATHVSLTAVVQSPWPIPEPLLMVKAINKMEKLKKLKPN